MARIRLQSNEYNLGALAGKYALKDMTNTGKFTNTLSVLPVRFEVEITDELSGIITLKEGSLLTVPDGYSETDGVTPVTNYKRIMRDIELNVGHRINDYSVSPKTHDKIYLVYDAEANNLEIGGGDMYAYHAEDVYGEDGDVRYFGNHFFHLTYGHKCALPLGYFDDAWHYHSFNALGFFENVMWVDMGTEYLIPRGRAEDYSLNIKNTRISEVVYTTYDEAVTGTTILDEATGFLMINNKGKSFIAENYKSLVEYELYDGYVYTSSENTIYDQLHQRADVCKVADVGVFDRKFDYIKNYNTYQAVDFSEIMTNMNKLDKTAVHLDGREETVYGNKDFKDNVKFDDIEINGGIINNVEVNEQLLLGDRGTFGGKDASFFSVGEDATYNNHIGLKGHHNANKAGIAFGESKSVRIFADSDIGEIDITIPVTKNESGKDRIPVILPAVHNVYEIGASGRTFKNIYSTTFTGTSTQTKWADLAEVYATDKEYPIGTLVQFGGEKEITIATDEVNAVISEAPAHVMNADGEGQPIALVGRVRIRVVDKVEKHAKIYLSDVPGIGSTKENGKAIARALESKETDGEGLVLCAVHFSI